jgi:DegV family protein with EDD domain
MAVQIVVDSTHYLPDPVVEAYGLHTVSLYVNWDGRTDRESDLPDFDGYYAYLKSGKEMPTTSQPSVGDFLAVYEPIIERGDDIVSIHLSAALSGTYASAEQARDHLVEKGVAPERIELVDSKTTCAGLAFPAMGAAGAARAGRDVAQVAQAARSVRAATKVWFAVDTLEFLRKGGRIGAAQAWVGSALKVKPILTLEAEVEPVERVRTANRAFERLVELLRERRADGCDRFIVQHIQDPERAEKMVDAGREIYASEPLFVSEIGPVIGAHAGPGLLGVAAIPSQLLGAPPQ